MRLLALDTSSSITSVALLDDVHGLVGERDADGAHSRDLLGVIASLLDAAGVVVGSLDAIAVGAGPGSFTGLRIGMATAKGLAFALGRPLHAVSSLAALALDATSGAPAGALIVPLVDARRGELFAGFYRAGDDGLVRPVAEERVLAPGALADAIAAAGGAPPVALCGDGAALVGPLGLGTERPGARVTPAAGAIARLAAGGLGIDGLLAAPRYLRQADVEVKFPDGVPPAGSFAPPRDAPGD